MARIASSECAVFSVGAVLCVALLTAQGGAWQQVPPVFRADTDVVRLEVGVLDRERRPVRDLTAADFIVFENGRERPVVAFTSVSLPTPESIRATPSASWVRDAPLDVVSNAGADQGRLLTIAIDWSVRSTDLDLARRIALAAVDGLGPGDEAAILFSSPFSNAGVPQNFTADRSRLRARINQAVATALVDKDGVIIDPDGYESGGCLCGMCTLEALTRVATSLRGVSQRPKVVLFISTYARAYEATMPPTRAMPRAPGPAAQAFMAANPNANTCPARLRDTRRTFERAAGEANITVHSLDPAGLVAGNGPLGGRERERLDSLAVVPDMTGGRTVQSTNAPEALVPAILEESSSYYVLGFTPDSTTRNGRSNQIEVRVRRPGVTVSARDRYTRDETPASALASDDAGLIQTLGRVLPSREVPLEVSLVPMLTGGRPGAAVFVVGRLHGDALPAPGNVSLLSAAFTPGGRSVASKRVMLRPSGTGANHSAMGAISGLPLEPGHYEVRVAVERPGGTGSVHAFVDVPDFAREPLALSGVLVHVAPEEATAPREEIDGMLPFVPTARRAFASTDTVSGFLQVTQGTGRSNPLRAIDLRTRVFDASGRAVRDQSMAIAPERFNRGRSTNARFSVPVGALAPGRYLLTVDARAGEDSATRTVRFEVR